MGEWICPVCRYVSRRPAGRCPRCGTVWEGAFAPPCDRCHFEASCGSSSQPAPHGAHKALAGAR